MAGMLGRVRSQRHKRCRRIIRIERGTVVLGVPFGAGSAHVMEFGPIGIEQASGQILQRFAQIDHHRVGSRSSSLSHGPLPAPSFPGQCPAKLLKSGREWLVISVLLRVRLIARHACSARRFRTLVDAALKLRLAPGDSQTTSVVRSMGGEAVDVGDGPGRLTSQSIGRKP
jgi:hypothetical protein